MRRKIRQDGGYRRLHDERDQEQEGKHREDRRGAQAEGRVELGLLYHGADLGLLHLDAHYHRRLVGINGCGFCGPPQGGPCWSRFSRVLPREIPTIHVG